MTVTRHSLGMGYAAGLDIWQDHVRPISLKVTLLIYDPTDATEVTSHRRNHRLDGVVQKLAVFDRYYINDFEECLSAYNQRVVRG